jgi:glutaredoxin
MRARSFQQAIENASEPERAMQSEQSHRVVLYTRQGCHLCVDAKQLLEAHGLTPVSIDIDANPTLRERFDTCVPVFEIDGQIRFRGRIEPVLLKRLLRD